jgi:peptidoglycan/LPS O-acetylase OafA/YrhL
MRTVVEGRVHLADKISVLETTDVNTSIPLKVNRLPAMNAVETVPQETNEVDNPLLLRGHNPALDGLRGLAILMVLFHHATPESPSTTLIGRVSKLLAEYGTVGVDLFFVLSGFLITGILLQAKGGPHYFRTFYARRSLRIFPLYYGVLLVSLVLVPLIWPMTSPGAQRIHHDQAWLWLYTSNIKGSLSAVDRPFTAGWYQFDHFWSLAVEEQFYLVWPVLILIMSRRAMVGVCAVLMAGALALRWWLYQKGDQTNAFYSLTPCRIDELAIGGLLALLGRERIDAAQLRRIAAGVFIVCGAVLVLIWKTDVRAMVIGGTLLAFFFAALIVLVVCGGPMDFVRRAFNFYPMRVIGKYSYAMYVLHPFLLAMLGDYLSYKRLGAMAHSGGLGVFLYVVIALIMTFAAGWLSWNLYEKHFLKLKRFVEYERP